MQPPSTIPRFSRSCYYTPLLRARYKCSLLGHHSFSCFGVFLQLTSLHCCCEVSTRNCVTVFDRFFRPRKMHWRASTRRLFSTAMSCLQRKLAKVFWFGLKMILRKVLIKFYFVTQINRKRILSQVRLRLDHQRPSFFFKQHAGFEYQRFVLRATVA